MKGIIIADPGIPDLVFSPKSMARIGAQIDLLDTQHSKESIVQNLELLRDVEVIVSSWGAPILDEIFLNHAPNLRALFYAAGSVKTIVTEASWNRGIVISAAPEANAIPVAEFTLSQILFGLKLGWQHNRRCKNGITEKLTPPGALGSTVGLISMGLIARKVRKHLENHSVNVITYDPNLSAAEATELDVEQCSLDELFARSNVVSLHTPELPETKSMICREHFAAMPSFATFINTARSSIVDHDGLISVLNDRTDLWAVLDVTECASTSQAKDLKKLTNVTLTPHIAGSLGPECQRMGDLIAGEIERFAQDQPLRHAVSHSKIQLIA